MTAGGSAQARILFVGNDSVGSNACSLRNAIVRSGHECLTWRERERSPLERCANRVIGVRTDRADVRRWNDGLAAVARAWSPDVVVVFKGIEVAAETISEMGCLTVHYHPDDSSHPVNRSALFDEAERLYDLHVTTKSHNVAELRSRGAAEVLYVRCAYDIDWHRPARGGGASAYFDVGFIGVPRPDRLPRIRRVAHIWGKGFLVVGDRWWRVPTLRGQATVRRGAYGFELSRTVAEAPVQLGFLNSANRDQHTCRSFEVPAAGGVLVAERTEEHAAILEEGKEALFFADDEEMLEAVRWLIAKPRLRERMGVAAAARMRASSNSYESRWQEMLRAIESLS